MEHKTHNTEQKDVTYHNKLKSLMDGYVNDVYRVTKKFPREEIFGVTSQYRRAALSVILNYIEGYARQRNAVYKNFLEISYASLKESKYIGYFSYRQSYLAEKEYTILTATAEEIGKILWGILLRLN